MSLRAYLEDSAGVIASAARSWNEELIAAAVATLSHVLGSGKTLLVCGNGGSASDAAHITGELVGRFLLERKAFRAICLTSNPSVLTAWANDCGYESVFARQVEAYGEPGGALLGLSTSGNSRNVIRAFEIARSIGLTTIALTGEGGGELAALSDYLFAVPSRATPLIQQTHVCLYHYLCQEVEKNLANRL